MLINHLLHYRITMMFVRETMEMENGRNCQSEKVQMKNLIHNFSITKEKKIDIL